MKFRTLKNRFIADLSYNRRKTKIPNSPNIHCIESTNKCNLNCIMCPRKDMTRKIGFMDFGVFKNIINECKDHMDFIYLHNMGESLFHPKLIEMIDYCWENGLRTGISTNATILNERMSRKILDSKLDKIFFSIDGVTKETYERIRKNADFKRTIDNIITFIKLKEMNHQKKPTTYIKIILMEETKEEISKFYKIWRDHKLDFVEIKYFNSWAGQLKETENLSKPEHRISYHIRRSKERQPCKWFWHNLVVLWDGTVVPCCRDYDAKIPLGNIVNTGLKEIWNCKKIMELRQEQIKLNFNNGLCDDCTEWIGNQSNPLYPLDINLYRGFRQYLGKMGISKTGIDVANF